MTVRTTISQNPKARITALLAATAVVLAGGAAVLLQTSGASPGPQGPCAIQMATTPPAFCDTFTSPAGTGNRSGDLNGLTWGVSRTTGDMNFGRPDPWVNSTLNLCGQQLTVNSPGDIRSCNGQLRESSNDNLSGAFEAGTVTDLAMYPKQPFDITGRTGTVSFDVSNDTQGTHAAWPEFWYTDKPLPSPFTHFGSWLAVPQNGLGIRFAAAGGNCPGGWTVDSAIVVRNYVTDDTAGFGQRSALTVTPTGCAKLSTNGALNHVELRISQNLIQVYASDAGTTSLNHIADIVNANLTLTRGLVWLEDVHYNADKSLQTPLQHDHSFTWDNVAFDGPVLPRDLTFDALDSLAPLTGGKFLGKEAGPGQQASFSLTPNVTAQNITDAAGALLMFNFWHEISPLTFSYTVNGHAHSFAWPYPPDGLNNTWRTIGLPILLADLVPGANTVTIGVSNNTAIEIANVDLLLVGAGGTPSTPTPIGTSTATAIATSTNTPTTPIIAATATPSATTTPSPVPTATPTVTVAPTNTPTGLCYQSADGGLTIVRIACP